MKSKEDLQINLDKVLAQIARLEVHEAPGVEQYFHLGLVGGSGHNVQKLNERRMNALDRVIDRSVELNFHYSERDRLQTLIDTFEHRQERARKAQEKRAAALERLHSVKCGQEVIITLGNTVTVRRVNKNSITTTTGTRYTFDELIDVVEVSL